MTAEIKLVLYFVGAFAAAVLLAPPVIKLLKRMKAGQNILGYVVQHEGKSGTPTMGGLIFLLPVIAVCLIEFTPFSLVAMSMIAGYAVLGFLDDFIKIRFNRNLGLKAYQKIIGQLGLAAVAAYFVYASPNIGTVLNIPWTDGLNLSWGIIPFVIFVFVATTNSVNLTDGIDGLAGVTSLAYFVVFSIILYFEYANAVSSGNLDYGRELLSLSSISVAVSGGLIGYLIFNAPPAKVFMGDTGSLGLGAAAATVAVFSKNTLFILTAGIIFVWSSISVIVQVLYFKASGGKRVFLMSPYHHHLEMKGWSESRIDALYFALTTLAGAVTLIFAGAI